MSDGESPTPTPRKRPTYGLPGPSGPAAGQDSADPQGPYGQGSYGQGPYGQQGQYGQQEQYGQQSQQGQYGQGTSFPSPHEAPPAGGPGQQSPTWSDAPQTALPQLPSQQSGPQRKRRGLVPLIIGIVLLVIIAPVAFIGGIIWSMGSVMGDTVQGPTVVEGGSGEIEVAANEMLILYVPAEDAEAAECTAESVGGGSISTVPTSGTTQFGDGSEYEQTLGVAALEDSTVAISCTGTEAPAYLGPYSLLGVAAPLLIGPIIGVVAGLIGLVLIIIGIVMLVRSRSS